MPSLKKNQLNIVRLFTRYNLYIIAVVLLIVSSCSRNREMEDQNSFTKKHIGKIELTDEEILALSYASPNEIPEDKALAIVKNFQNQLKKNPQTKSNNASSYSVLKKTFINEKGTTVPPSQVITKGNFRNNIPIYNVLVSSGTDQSIAYVSADERMPDVIAIIPTRGGLTLNDYSIDPMLLLAQKALAQNASDLNLLIDSLNRPTLKKLEEKFGKLPSGKIYETFKDNIISKSNLIKIKSTVQASVSNIIGQVGPLLQTYWKQEDPFNDQMPVVNDVNAFCYGGGAKYSAGCFVVAACQVLSYCQPNMTIKVDNVNVPLQWNAIMANPNGDDGWGNYYASYDYNAFKHVTGLFKTVFDGCQADTACGGSSVISSNGINFLTNYLAMDNSNPPTGVNMTTIKSSLDMLKIVLATGYRKPYSETDENGNPNPKVGHAWVVDGYAITRLNPGQTIVGNNVWQRFNMYLHANMGWGAPSPFWGLNGTGWYLVGKDNSGSLTFQPNDAQHWEIDLKFYSNITKK